MDETQASPDIESTPPVEITPTEVVIPTPEATTASAGEPTDPDVSEVPASASTPSFEQRVEERFIALEQALMNLPHSIATVLHRGSMEAEEFAKQVIAHLFDKE